MFTSLSTTAATTALILAAGGAFAETKSVTAEIWVDNWFSLYVNGENVGEDSVPITTERSFNAEKITFTADMPMTIGIMAKDFKENESGLEYIGTNRQQTGDGGMIAQFRDDATGEVIAVSDDAMKCLVVQHAPVDRSCAKESDPVAGVGACAFEMTDTPDDWADSEFDDNAWPHAVEHTVREVSPKQGYDEIKWDAAAQLVWSDDLVLDNTLLCRMNIAH
jgi:hypothetical protein